MIASQVWLGLKPETRKIISILLDIPRSGGMEVVGGIIVSDGYTPTDLATVTLEKLQNFMGDNDEDFYKLFNQLVHNVELPPVEINVQTMHVQEKSGAPRFCDFCDSKGVRHKKECPKLLTK